MTMFNESKLQEVEAQTLKQWLAQQEVVLIDVREPAEYVREHIPGAKLLPLSTFKPEQISQEQHQKFVLCCQSSNRSAQAAHKLLSAGFAEVIHLKGGLSAWKAAEYPTEVKKNAPISLMRQVQIVAGSLVLLGIVLSVFVSPCFLLLSGFVGAGLIFAGITNTCAMAVLLAKLPYNQPCR
jgi:rhodanese-related sulfurtransferase